MWLQIIDLACSWPGLGLLVSFALASGLALTGHGSDAGRTDWPREDWR